MKVYSVGTFFRVLRSVVLAAKIKFIAEQAVQHSRSCGRSDAWDLDLQHLTKRGRRHHSFGFSQPKPPSCAPSSQGPEHVRQNPFKIRT